MDEVEWQEFSLGNTNVFSLSSTLSGIDKNKLIDSEKKMYPYITRTDFNNGLDMFVGKQEKPLNQGNVISIGLDTQTVFYQQTDFYTGQNIQVLSMKQMTQNIAMFMIPLIKKQLETLSWGGNGATLGRLKKKSILLPVDESGNLHLTFMEKYGRIKSSQVKGTLRFPSLNTNIYDKRNLGEVNFSSFPISDLFDFSRGREGNMQDLTGNRYPLISAKKIRNGLKQFVDVEEIRLFNGNVITLNNDGDGGVGLAYYQPYKMAVDTHVTVLTPKFKANRFVLQFVATTIRLQREKFSHGYSINTMRLSRQRIVLPNKDGEPDFEFMEQYMKRMEKRILEKYR